MYYAQFYRMTESGTYVESLGSDQMIQVDGRKTIYNMCEEAHQYAHRLRKVNKFDGFAICRGTILNPTFITTIHETRYDSYTR